MRSPRGRPWSSGQGHPLRGSGRWTSVQAYGSALDSASTRVAATHRHDRRKCPGTKFPAVRPGRGRRGRRDAGLRPITVMARRLYRITEMSNKIMCESPARGGCEMIPLTPRQCVLEEVIATRRGRGSRSPADMVGRRRHRDHGVPAIVGQMGPIPDGTQCKLDAGGVGRHAGHSACAGPGRPHASPVSDRSGAARGTGAYRKPAASSRSSHRSLCDGGRSRTPGTRLPRCRFPRRRGSETARRR